MYCVGLVGRLFGWLVEWLGGLLPCLLSRMAPWLAEATRMAGVATQFGLVGVGSTSTARGQSKDKWVWLFLGSPNLWCILLGCWDVNLLPTNGFPLKPLKVKLLAGEQSLQPRNGGLPCGFPLTTPKQGYPQKKTDPNALAWDTVTERSELRDPIQHSPLLGSRSCRRFC